MTQANEMYLQAGRILADAEESQLFGKPCFKIQGKAFVCFFKECMVFKLTGEAHQKALSLAGSSLFDPSGKGRPMKEWVQVPYAHGALWPEYARESYAYVSGAATKHV